MPTKRGKKAVDDGGRDVLFRALHADHEEVMRLFESVLGDDVDTKEEWQKLSQVLLAHVRAEQETVYERLKQERRTRDQIPHSIEEHDRIERQLAEADAMGPGTDVFCALVNEIEKSVRDHVNDEEQQLLPAAREALSDEDLEDIVARFQARKRELMPGVEQEVRKGARAGRARGAGRAAGRRGASGRAPARTTTRKRKKAPSGNLQDRTVEELRDMARKRDIRGFSKMKKQELVDVLASSK